jgi:acid phosphatase
MSSKILKILLLLFLPLWLNAKTIPDLYTVKQQLATYHDSGQYDQGIRRVDKQAQTYLAKRIAENKKLAQPEKLAVVFDIDETTLSNYPNMKIMDFGGTPDATREAIDEAKDPPIKASLELYNFAKTNGVTVFFVTGRREFQRKAAIKNLKEAGYTDWEALFMKPNDYKEYSVIPYKSATRKKITEMGYDIVFTIGDQWSDSQGGYADKSFKLPNPFYFLP